MSLAFNFLAQYLAFLGTLPIMSTTVLCFVLGLGIVYFVLGRVINL